jgi:hypothetical protein
MSTATVEIRKYEPGDEVNVVRHMRLSDRREIYYLAALTPTTVDGVPEMLFGICRRSQLSDVGVPWLLGTDVVDRHQFAFRRSREYFRRFERAFPVMENHALAENFITLRWLQWLGFDMSEPQPYGVFGVPFVRFGRRLEECA